MNPNKNKPSWEYIYEMHRKRANHLRYRNNIDNQRQENYLYRTIHKLQDSIRRFWQ